LGSLLLQDSNSFNFGATVSTSSAYTTSYQFNGQVNQVNSKNFATTNFNLAKTAEYDLSSGTNPTRPSEL
jgi:hypothetical protein